MIDTILTLEEAANLLGVHEKTLTRWLQKGEIDGCRFPGKRRIYFLKGELVRLREQGIRKRGRPRKGGEQIAVEIRKASKMGTLEERREGARQEDGSSLR